MYDISIQEITWLLIFIKLISNCKLKKAGRTSDNITIITMIPQLSKGYKLEGPATERERGSPEQVGRQ
jgi:hypothetical protein